MNRDTSNLLINFSDLNEGQQDALLAIPQLVFNLVSTKPEIRLHLLSTLNELPPLRLLNALTTPYAVSGFARVGLGEEITNIMRARLDVFQQNSVIETYGSRPALEQFGQRDYVNSVKAQLVDPLVPVSRTRSALADAQYG